MKSSVREKWRPVDGWPYEVSDYGRVRRIRCDRRTRLGRLLKPQFGDPSGYPQVWLYKDGRRQIVRVHLLVAYAFLGPPPEGRETNHRDGVKANCRLSNLEYVTRSENVLHAFQHGLRETVPLLGESNGAARLTTRQVQVVRQLTGEGISQRTLAARYGVCQQTISLIVRGLTWSHVREVA